MVNQFVRSKILPILRSLGLNRAAGKFYYRFLHGFAPASKGLPEAVNRSFQIAETNGLLENADYCEFGVFKGYTFLHAQKVATEIDASGMRFFGFDSFAGLPPPTTGDQAQDKHQPFYEGQYSCSLEQVKKDLDKGGVDWDKSFLIKGYFNESLKRKSVLDLMIKKVSIALIDCDLYSSTVHVLEFLESRLVDGAIVLMDDWKSYGDSSDHGQPKAMRKFLARNPELRAEKLFDYEPYGRVFALYS